MPILTNSKFTTASVSVASTSADASATLLYTCPANYTSIIRYVFISNATGSAKQIYIQWYDSSSTTYFTVANAVSVAANSTFELIAGGLLALHGNDTIRVYKEAGATFNATLSTEEFYDPARGGN
tara:strand:+ start:70 stop:444 length:375 start_codon:yes stop_codon:yes gene_type:complete